MATTAYQIGAFHRALTLSTFDRRPGTDLVRLRSCSVDWAGACA